MPELRQTRDQIRFALEKANAVIAVSAALRELAVAAGAAPEKVLVLRNGVDAERFRPLPSSACRQRLNLPNHRRVLVSVGFLVPRKGHDLLLRAVARLPAEERPVCVIAGDGPEDRRLRALTRELGLEGDVRLIGAVNHDEVAEIYSAADLSVLASSREGWPNVLLESMACGTPVVATAVHGSPEVVTDRSVGLLVEDRSPEGLAAAIREGLTTRFDRDHVRRYAESMSWRETSEGLDQLFRSVVDKYRTR